MRAIKAYASRQELLEYIVTHLDQCLNLTPGRRLGKCTKWILFISGIYRTWCFPLGNSWWKNRVFQPFQANVEHTIRVNIKTANQTFYILQSFFGLKIILSTTVSLSKCVEFKSLGILTPQYRQVTNYIQTWVILRQSLFKARRKLNVRNSQLLDWYKEHKTKLIR